MTKSGCERKHTPLTSKKQVRFAYAVERAQKTGKGSAKVKKAAKSWPSKGPSSPKAHIEEAKGKNLPTESDIKSYVKRHKRN